MSVHITRRALVGSASAAAALWLTGCATTAAPREENIRPATFSNLGARAAPATPLTAKRIPMPVVDAFKGDGIFFFDDDEGAQFRITDLIRENNRYKVEEDYAFGKPHGFSWGSGAVGIMRDGRRVPPENPTGLRPEGDHVVIEFDGREKLELRVTLEAYDVSGQEILFSNWALLSSLAPTRFASEAEIALTRTPLPKLHWETPLFDALLETADMAARQLQSARWP